MAQTIHIGKMIKNYIDKNKLYRTDIAKRIGIPSTAIYSYEARESIFLKSLLRLCHALKYNFFMDIANQLPKDYGYDANFISDKDALIKQQAEEIYKLTLENNLMKELMQGKR